MKPKPVPKEIAALPFQTNSGVALMVSYESPDAKEFAYSLDEFGTLTKAELRNSVIVILSPTFDWRKVLEYIESFND